MALQKCGLSETIKIKNFSHMVHWNSHVQAMNQLGKLVLGRSY